MDRFDLITLVASLAVGAVLILYIVFLQSERDALTAKNAQLETVIASQTAVIRLQQEDLEASNKLIETLGEKRAEIAEKSNKWRQEVEAAKQDNPSFENWANSALPAELCPGGRLRENRAGGTAQPELPPGGVERNP